MEDDDAVEVDSQIRIFVNALAWSLCKYRIDCQAVFLAIYEQKWIDMCREDSGGSARDVPDEYWTLFKERLNVHAPPGVKDIYCWREAGATWPGGVRIQWKLVTAQIELDDPARGFRVRHWPAFLAPLYAKELLDELRAQVPWEREKIVMRGRTVEAARLTATYGDSPELTYGYAGVRKRALGWTPALLELKKAAEATTGCTLNYAILNLYRDGNDSIGYHADKVADLVPGSTIVSISLGAERDFLLKPNDGGDTKTIALAAGSMLTMEGTTQQHYKHSVPPRKQCKEPRINITFRHVRPAPVKKTKRSRMDDEKGPATTTKKRRLDSTHA